MFDFHEGLAAERSDGLPWVDFGVGAWPAERQHSMWDTKMRQKRAPYNASKTHTLSTKVRRKCAPLGRKSTSKPLSVWGTRMRQKRVPLARKCVENAHP